MGCKEKRSAIVFAVVFLLFLVIADGQRIAIRRKLPKKPRTTAKPKTITSPTYEETYSFGPHGFILPTGAPDSRCSPPDVFVNGSLVDHDFDDDVREIHFEGQVGPDTMMTPCKIRCINGAWVGPICTSAGKTVKKDQILRRCTARLTDAELLGRVDGKPLPQDTEVSIPHGSELRLRCSEPGLYKFVGNESLICDDGEWTEDMPYCVSTTLHRNFSMQAPPTILYHVVSGDAGLDEDGQIVVFPGTILNIDCIYQSKFGNPHWAWTSSHRQYPSAWAIPAEEKSWKFRLSIYYAKEYDSGTYICTTPQDISNEITVLVKEVNCPGIGSVDHSRVMSVDGNRMHSRARFACLEGFGLKGRDQITCLPSGQWSEDAPHCEVLRCPSLALDTTHLIVSTRNRTFGTRVIFSCPTGFELAGAPFITCLPSANWSDATPTCRPIRCPPPVAPINGRVVDSGRHLAGDFVQYTCNAGHVVVGEHVAVCTDHGVWSHQTPTCKAACEFPGEPSNGHVIPTKFHYSIGEVVVVGCQQGYRVLGYQRLRCTTSGHWSTPLPHCRPYLAQQT